MQLKFTKMHGLGNDFVVFNGLDEKIDLNPDQVRAIADRHLGVGCDQVLLLQPSEQADTDVRYRIFNASGGEVEQCGNGARCVADYLSKNGYVNGDTVTLETMKGNTIVYLDGEDKIRVNMGVPQFDPADIPMIASKRNTYYLFNSIYGTFNIMALSMGNPHVVLIVDDVEQAPVALLGQEIQSHKTFPQGANVGFMQILDSSNARLRVYERGAGETLACGSGACAAMVAGHMNNKLESEVNIGLKGGYLSVSWAGEGEPVWMTGPATTVYEGQISL